MFDTKIALVVRENLAVWQKLNVTAFLVSGIVGAHEGLLGEPYTDAAGNAYHPLAIQPMLAGRPFEPGLLPLPSAGAPTAGAIAARPGRRPHMQGKTG